MPDEKTSIPQGTGDVPGDLGGESLNDMLNPPVAEPETKPEAKKPEGAEATSFSADDVRKLLKEQEDKLEERFGEIEQTNTFLRGQNTELQEQLRRGSQPAPEQPKEFTYDENEIAKEMEVNAPKALINLVTKFLDHKLDGIRKEVGKDVDTRVGNADAVRRHNEAYTADIVSINKEFADQMKDKAFIKDADAEIATIIRARGGSSLRDYQPGDLHNAASRVALRWAREGKLTFGEKKPEAAENSGVSLREIVRRVPASDSVNGSNGKGPSGPPKTIAQLFPGDERSQRIAHKIIKGQGVSEEAYVRQYLKAKQEDSDFDA